MDEHWALIGCRSSVALAAALATLGLCGCPVLEVEAYGQHEVKLRGRALMRSLERIEDPHVDLRSVEGAVAFVERPRSACLLLELIERLRHVRLRLGPCLQVAERVVGPRRELQLEVHAEVRVHGRDEVKHIGHLHLDLRHGAKDVSVVLLEAAYAREPCERARELVAVENAEVAEANRQLAVRAQPSLEHHAVGGAVHWLEAKLLPLDGEEEHVLLVLGSVPRCLPQLQIEHVRRDHLGVLAESVLVPDNVHQLVVDARSVGLEEARAGREVVKEE
mmetsp:Transcript_9667/g.21108  ORF Transcript_9667/g.21108 Transcript_9667/m.21108 type:complete len:277 (-) Transcript_9667:1172-2002(-)